MLKPIFAAKNQPTSWRGFHLNLLPRSVGGDTNGFPMGIFPRWKPVVDPRSWELSKMDFN